MEFVQKFTPPDFRAKNFTPSISPNLNSFSKRKHKKWVKMEKFTPLAKSLHCRRHWRHGQIPPLAASALWLWRPGCAVVAHHPARARGEEEAGAGERVAWRGEEGEGGAVEVVFTESEALLRAGNFENCFDQVLGGDLTLFIVNKAIYLRRTQGDGEEKEKEDHCKEFLKTDLWPPRSISITQ